MNYIYLADYYQIQFFQTVSKYRIYLWISFILSLERKKASLLASWSKWCCFVLRFSLSCTDVVGTEHYVWIRRAREVVWWIV